MAITVLQVLPNQMVPASLAPIILPVGPPAGLSLGQPHICSGIVECVFKGDNPDSDGVTRDTLTFLIGGSANQRVNPPPAPGGVATSPFGSSLIVSLASIAYDGVVNNALWAVDSAEVTQLVNTDRGDGTSQAQAVANLAVRGPNGIILRVNYILFWPT